MEGIKKKEKLRRDKHRKKQKEENEKLSETLKASWCLGLTPCSFLLLGRALHVQRPLGPGEVPEALAVEKAVEVPDIRTKCGFSLVVGKAAESMAPEAHSIHQLSRCFRW